MLVNYYLKKYADKEALVRLWAWHPHGYANLGKYDSRGVMDDVCTVQEFLNGEHWLSKYKNEVIVQGLDDNDVAPMYHGAINLVILPEESFNN